MRNLQKLRERYTNGTPHLEEHLCFYVDLGVGEEISDVECRFMLLADTCADIPGKLSGKLDYLEGKDRDWILLTLDRKLRGDTVTQSWALGKTEQRNQALLDIPLLSAMPLLKKLIGKDGLYLHEILAAREVVPC